MKLPSRGKIFNMGGIRDTERLARYQARYGEFYREWGRLTRKEDRDRGRGKSEAVDRVWGQCAFARTRTRMCCPGGGVSLSQTALHHHRKELTADGTPTT